MRVLGAIAIVCGLVLLSVLSAAHPQAAPEYARASYWAGRIASNGGSAAYAELKRIAEKKPGGQQHVLAHAFGEALYVEMGVNGFPVCDQSFEAGCYHEFLARAIADHGLSEVTALREICFDALGDARATISCEHGIGHGIVAHLGYTPDALGRALSTCMTLPSIDPVKGCLGGAFMEYNLQVMLGKDAVPPHFSKADPAGVCSSISTNLRPAFYFWLNQWWYASTKHDTPEATAYAFRAMGSYCSKIGTTPRLLEACFRGIGYWASPEGHFDADKTAALCAQVSSESRDRISCWSVAGETVLDSVTDEALRSLCAGDDFGTCVESVRYYTGGHHEPVKLL